MPRSGRTFTQSMMFQVLKYILIAVFLLSNLLTIALGIGLIVLGINAIKEVSGYNEITAGIIIFHGIVFCVLGIVLSVLINKCHPDAWIEFFLLVLIVLFVQEMVVGIRILTSTLKKDHEAPVKKYLKELYLVAKSKHFSGWAYKRIESVHKTYQCCGYSGKTDAEVIITPPPLISLYPSCCRKPINDRCTVDNAFEEPCWKPVAKAHVKIFYDSSSLAIAFGSVLGLVLLLAVYFKLHYTHRPDNFVE